jgi:ubiquinone biosynthesis monooxygenase Coq7
MKVQDVSCLILMLTNKEKKKKQSGQLAVLDKNTPESAEIRRMYEQELHHLETMSKLVVRHRARPSLLSPIWHVGGYALGAVTALLGKEAAMACTVAVETEISQHYNAQLREILARDDHAEMAELQEILQKFRDDELGHMDAAIEHGASRAPSYNLLTGGWTETLGKC